MERLLGYTSKEGDDGNTEFNHLRVPKSHLGIATLAALDILQAQFGFLSFRTYRSSLSKLLFSSEFDDYHEIVNKIIEDLDHFMKFLSVDVPGRIRQFENFLKNHLYFKVVQTRRPIFQDELSTELNYLCTVIRSTEVAVVTFINSPDFMNSQLNEKTFTDLRVYLNHLPDLILCMMNHYLFCRSLSHTDIFG